MPRLIRGGVRLLCVGLLAQSLLTVAAPARAATRPQFSLVSAAVLANGAETRATMNVTCPAHHVINIGVTLTQHRSVATDATREVYFAFRCSGAKQTFTESSFGYGAGLEPRMHPGTAAAMLDYYDNKSGAEIQRFMNITMPSGSLYSRAFGQSAVLLGRGGVVDVRATITCKPGGNYEPHALVSQPISPTQVQIGESAYDVYSGGPLLHCPHSPLVITVPVPGYSAAFHAGQLSVWLEVNVYGRNDDYLRSADFVGVVTAVAPAQSATGGILP